MNSLSINKVNIDQNFSYIVLFNKGKGNKKNTTKYNPRYWENSHQQSSAEARIEQWLNQRKVFHMTEARFSSCKNPRTGQVLSFDFFIPGQKLCIEYQGEQHEQITSFMTGTKEEKLEKIKQQQFKDEVKVIYCQQLGFKLLVINFRDYNIIEEILEKNIKYKRK